MITGCIQWHPVITTSEVDPSKSPTAQGIMVRKHHGRRLNDCHTNDEQGDPAYEMYRQATLGDVDFITGDYLAGIHPARKEMGEHSQFYRGQYGQ